MRGIHQKYFPRQRSTERRTVQWPKINDYHLGEYYTCQEGIITLEKKCPEGLYYYDPCNEDTTDNDVQAKCGFGMFFTISRAFKHYS